MNRYQKDADIKLFFHHSEIYTLFEELIHKPWGHRIWQPFLDIFEQDDLFMIKIDLPGINAEAVNVSVSGTKLFIEGKRPFEKNLKNAKALVCERPRGIFVREIEFFERLLTTKIKKRYDKGVLTITVKKDKSK